MEGTWICEARGCKCKLVNENHSHFHNYRTIIILYRVGYIMFKGGGGEKQRGMSIGDSKHDIFYIYFE